jgi:extradiol dioxygenase family protein
MLCLKYYFQTLFNEAAHMKRFHIHISVEDLSKNIQFYSQLFNAEPTVIKDDYAKWALDDPAVNFAISNRSSKVGLDHVGIQTETDEELKSLQQQLEAAGVQGVAQDNTTCCYTRSDKYWIQDPQGIAWETFHSLESVPVFSDTQLKETEDACCAPGLSQSSTSCC